MSPRPRQASDEAILMAAFRAIARLGPARMTLADVARDAGVSPAALVQRFGSKRALLLAVSADAAGGSAYIFPGLRARHARPIDALLGLAECITVMGTSPDEIANNLAFFRIELKDEDFHRHALTASNGMRAGIRSLVKEAIAAGELARCKPGRLADALHATLNGSLLNWAVHRDGAVEAFVRRDLSTVLALYRTKGPKAGRRARQKRQGSSPKPTRV
jgi:AcrR family transcriptional regulator